MNIPTPAATPAAPAPEFTLPRKKHSHRCQRCGQGTYCYKKNCTKPQRIPACLWCR